MAQVSWQELIEAGRSGSALISFSTDTVPALAVRPDQASLIYAAKQRSETKPLILMGGDPENLWEYVQGSPAELKIWQKVAARHWAGALTLVLPASDRLPPAMNPTDPTTIGIRIPDSAIARHLLRQTGPLATTSINRSGEPPLTTIEAINEQFPQVLTLSPTELSALEAQLMPNVPTLAPSAIPSTVAKWTGSDWEILRQGAISLAMLL